MPSKGINTFGAIALLVSSMTVSFVDTIITCLVLPPPNGPGLSTIPPMFQQSGWLAPMFVFVAVAVLSGFSALFICEVLSSIKGNEKFQANVEFTTVAQLILGKKYHYFFQIVLYLALQAVNVASIILSAQTLDSMFLTLFDGTCGLGVSPGRWFCISERSVLGNSPFSADDYYIFTFGYLVTAAMVMPLGFFSLVENIYVQMISFIVLCGVLIQWIVAFCQVGLDTSLLPASGPDSSTVLGIVIFNYAYITTIPTMVNDLRPDVSIHKSLWISVVISTIMYILLGVFGAMAYRMEPTADILAILSSQGSTASLVTTYIFPICALVTSIPVFTIVIRQNLMRGNICGRPWAVFWSNILPWFVCIPLQTKDYVGTIQNWSSLFFQSTINFILPFILYFASRKYQASVLEETKETSAPHTSNSEKHPPEAENVEHDEDQEEEKQNEVEMHYPDENRSVSIRRLGRTSHLSRLEVGGSPSLKSPRSPKSPRTFRSPLSPRSPKSPGATPVIMFDETGVSPASRLQVHEQQPTSNSAPGSPNILKVPPPESSPRASTTSAGSGLGITPSTTANELSSNTEEEGISHNDINGNGATTTNKKPERTSWISSNFSFRNNTHHGAVAPTSPAIRLNNKSDACLDDDDDDCTDKKNISMTVHDQQPVQDDNAPVHFLAFKPRSWLNPFYVAIVSSGLLGVAIVFMIIYNLTMLGLGNNVFD
ncbi:hypothetical protein BDB00DRAFT_952354 [Zychaea mexicana]|uniref:uncharacterized protein n=1 Tax=Zychaea mexicana TaxID=64656 RepID=UPI0022FE27B1|nr:uncharacterized protein BDB00DRAFT_952354 [Zychaea mexicana]KAI9496786.1 hypothetical protein BDB00DRAFT_952354 [Zychaea mexicana]